VSGASTLWFEGFELDLARGELRRDGGLVEIQSKLLALLVYLVEHRDRFVTKAELLEQVWPDVFVSEQALFTALRDLRRILGDDGAAQRLIRSWRGRGYRFVAPVRAARVGSVRALERHATSPRRSLLPFVGRAEEIEWLAERLAACRDGRPSVVLVSGEAGIGKTRLLAELTSTPACEDVVVARGRCSEDLRIPYRPLAEALSSWLLELGGDGRDRFAEDDRALGEILRPAATASRGGEDAGPLDPTRARTELFIAATRTVLRLAERQPALLWIDDLQWADASTLDLFAHLAAASMDAARRGPCRLLLAATVRTPVADDETVRFLARLEASGHCVERRLPGLDVAQVSEFLALPGSARPAPAAADRLHASTGGSPFLVEELLRQAADLRVGIETLLAAGAAAQDPVAAVAARLDRLPASCRAALDKAAFIGERFGQLAVALLVGCDREDLRATLEVAEAHGLVVSEGNCHRFAHPLVRHVLQSALGEAERRRIHAEIADVLEDLYAGSPDEHALELGHHLLLAGADVSPDRLLRVARPAADQAFALCAWADAARFYEATLDAGHARLAAPERGALHLRAGIAFDHDLVNEACTRHYAAAAAAFEDADDSVGRARATMYLARAHVTRGAIEKARLDDVSLLDALAERVSKDHPVLQGLVLETISEILWSLGRIESARGYAERALVLGHNLDDDALAHHACMGLALARFSLLQIDDAIAAWREALGRARRLRDPWLESSPAPRIAMGLLSLGKLPEAIRCADEAMECSTRTHHLADRSLALAQQAALHLLAGRADEAIDSAEACARVVAAASYPWAAVLAVPAHAAALVLEGHSREALAVLATLAEPQRVFPDPPPQIRVLAQVYRDLVAATDDAGPVDRNRVVGLATIVAQPGSDVSVVSLLCALLEIAVRAGISGVAGVVAPTLRSAYERGVRVTPGWPILLSRALAQTEWEAGDVSRCARAYDTALDDARALGSKLELARTLLEAAAIRELAAASPSAAEDRTVATLRAEAHAVCRDFAMPFDDPLARRLCAISPR
jgi:DNA-binding winged helix-turn-helix (wHTH) protein/tetratricopeptide (TPR) repeat protein